jgi:diguanylate cyclase (GGDEF)-like protein
MRPLAHWLEEHVGSFRFRLAAYVLLLSLLPLLGAGWAFSEVASRREVLRVDARLNGALRVATGDFSNLVQQAEQTASSLARATAFQQALTGSNRRSLARLYREVPQAAFYAHGHLAAGTPAPPASVGRFAVMADENGAPLGRVVVSVPLDDELVAELRTHPAFTSDDRLALIRGDVVVAGPHALADTKLSLDRAADVSLAGEDFRVLADRLPGTDPPAALIAYTPKTTIEAGVTGLRRRVLLFGGLALAIACMLAYVLGGAIVRSLKQLSDAAADVARGHFGSRVPIRGRDEFTALARAFNGMAEQLETRVEELARERSRMRLASARLGEALSAAHSPHLLMPVIVESTVEATGAAGGRITVDGEEITRTGEPDHGPAPLAVPLGDSGAGAGVLLLTPQDRGFSDEARELAYWLGSQAQTALENASAHKRLEAEAVTDGLTGLPNRRHFEEALARELSRVKRFGGALAVIVADLDDFKQVNDRYGHLAGDDMLRAFAKVLRQSLRETDTPVRYGGEEFAVLVPETDALAAGRAAERIRASLQAKTVPTFPGALVTVTASFGVAAYPDCATDEQLFLAADEALYRAKAAGKNRVAISAGTTAVRLDA